MPNVSKAYNATSKTLFHPISTALLAILIAQRALRMESLEFFTVKQQSPDLLLTLEDGSLFHLELQTDNDIKMPLRMLEYYSLIWQHYNQAPTQMVLYLGWSRLSMTTIIAEKTLQFSYPVQDIRDINCQPLAESTNIGDNRLSFLCKNGTTLDNLRKILRRIQGLPNGDRQDALAQLLLLSPLRWAETLLTSEIKRMPIQMDLRDHPYIQEMLKATAFAAKQEGEAEGKLESKMEMAKAMLAEGLEAAFIAKITGLSLAEIDQLSNHN
jgi:predicted transposase/invertase (TIGR01784 family)